MFIDKKNSNYIAEKNKAANARRQGFKKARKPRADKGRKRS